MTAEGISCQENRYAPRAAPNKYWKMFSSANQRFSRASRHNFFFEFAYVPNEFPSRNDMTVWQSL